MQGSPRYLRTVRRPVLVGLCVLACLPAGGCDGRLEVEAVAQRARPDIFLITVDALRADRLGSYGYELPTSPFIDSLAVDGVRFDSAYSTSSWTVPALVSMLTSSYPRRHGMGERGAGRKGRWHVTPSYLSSLPEILGSVGYRTYGFTANFGLPAERGFSRGFNRYRCIGAVDVEEVHHELERWFPDLRDGGPWFLWLHLFDTHAPYDGREPWLSQLYPDLAASALDRGSVSASMVSEAKVPQEVIDRAKIFYDSEVRHLDDYLETLFELLPRARDAVVLFTADHGEEFLDHGDVLHGRNLYDPTTRIPFVLRLPGGRFAGRVVDEPVSLVDVLPTLLSAAGVQQPAGLAGTDLIEDILEQSSPARRSVFVELGNSAHQRAATDGRWKYIAPDDAEPMLFDLERDPGETHNRATDRADLAKEFRRLLAAYVRDHSPPPSALDETDITEEQAKALRTLGYIQ